MFNWIIKRNLSRPLPHRTINGFVSSPTKILNPNSFITHYMTEKEFTKLVIKISPTLFKAITKRMVASFGKTTNSEPHQTLIQQIIVYISRVMTRSTERETWDKSFGVINNRETRKIYRIKYRFKIKKP